MPFPFVEPQEPAACALDVAAQEEEKKKKEEKAEPGAVLGCYAVRTTPFGKDFNSQLSVDKDILRRL